MQGSVQVFSTPYLYGDAQGCLYDGFTEINYGISDISGIVSHSWSVSAGGQIINDYGTAIAVRWSQAGSKTVTYNFQASGGCNGTFTYTTTLFPQLTLSASITEDTHCVAPFNGAIDLTVSGLVGTASYNWNGGTLSANTTEDVTGLQPDSYSVEVTDTQTGCTVYGDYNLEDTHFDFPSYSLNPIDNTHCTAPYDGSVTLSNIINFNNPTYSWTGPNGFTSSASSLTALAPGTYGLTVTNPGSGCSLTISDGELVIIDSSNPIDAIVNSVSDNENCLAPFNGAIDIDVTGGTAYTYSWTGPNSFQSTTQDVNGIKDGTYQVTVTETSSKCTDQETVNIALYNPGSAVSTFQALDSGGGASGQGYFCPGSAVTLFLEFDGATPGPYNVVYSNGISDFTLSNIVN